MGRKKALITGIAGQDGSYLCEFLLRMGYEVHGIIRRASYPNTKRIDHLFEIYDESDRDCLLRIDYGDLCDDASLRRMIDSVEPDEIYNLGAQSHVGVSFKASESTMDINAMGPLRILEALRLSGATSTRFYQASSSEMFGGTPPPQNEQTAFLPQSPYGVAKLAAFHMTRLYRDAYGLFASNGILFNHESPRRGLNFVTRKITRGIAAIVAGDQDRLRLGYLDAKRDWGFAGDYVRAIWKILQHDVPDDFVVATGETHTVREFLAETFSLVGLDWTDFVERDPKQLRPAEVPALLGDATKIRSVLGWEPEVVFKDLCSMMLEHDLKERGMTLEVARKRAAALMPTMTGIAAS